ncbi:MAG: hydrogenase/urease maturation nickel metallochaperone HypA [Patescibacteria group bacterium]|nr:hydrogenase/urease maturation nickel metallochaperone HypA [Patescibacteria group bacterium]
MHDLYAAQDILEAAMNTAKTKKLKKITKLVIDLGEVKDHGEEITPANLRFNLKMLAKKTIANNAQIEIKHTSGGKCLLKEIVGEC